MQRYYINIKTIRGFLSCFLCDLLSCKTNLKQKFLQTVSSFFFYGRLSLYPPQGSCNLCPGNRHRIWVRNRRKGLEGWNRLSTGWEGLSGGEWGWERERKDGWEHYRETVRLLWRHQSGSPVSHLPRIPVLYPVEGNLSTPQYSDLSPYTSSRLNPWQKCHGNTMFKKNYTKTAQR